MRFYCPVGQCANLRPSPEGIPYRREIAVRMVEGGRSMNKPIEEMTLAELAEWVKMTCLMFGASPATAYKVAGTFVEGLERTGRK